MAPEVTTMTRPEFKPLNLKPPEKLDKRVGEKKSPKNWTENSPEQKKTKMHVPITTAKGEGVWSNVTAQLYVIKFQKAVSSRGRSSSAVLMQLTIDESEQFELM